ETRTLWGHANSVAFSPDGRRIASAGDDDMVVVWDAGTGQETRSAIRPTALPGVKVRDAGAPQPALALKGHTSDVMSVAFSPTGHATAPASGDRTGKAWDACTGLETSTLKGHANLVKSVAFSPDERRIASASHDGTVKLWDAGTGQETLTLKGHIGGVMSVAF